MQHIYTLCKGANKTTTISHVFLKFIVIVTSRLDLKKTYVEILSMVHSHLIQHEQTHARVEATISCRIIDTVCFQDNLPVPTADTSVLFTYVVKRTH
jgi:hypothetical protein